MAVSSSWHCIQFSSETGSFSAVCNCKVGSLTTHHYLFVVVGCDHLPHRTRLSLQSNRTAPWLFRWLVSHTIQGLRRDANTTSAPAALLLGYRCNTPSASLTQIAHPSDCPLIKCDMPCHDMALASTLIRAPGSRVVKHALG